MFQFGNYCFRAPIPAAAVDLMIQPGIYLLLYCNGTTYDPLDAGLCGPFETMAQVISPGQAQLRLKEDRLAIAFLPTPSEVFTLNDRQTILNEIKDILCTHRN